MEHVAVDSSAIHSIGYDKDTQHMEIKFKNGGTYRYPEVSPETHAAFINAESHGEHFRSHIRHKHVGTKL